MSLSVYRRNTHMYKSIYDYLHKIFTEEIEASDLTYIIYAELMPSTQKQGIVIAKIGGDTIEKVYITGDKLLSFKFTLRSSQELPRSDDDETKIKLSDFLDRLVSLVTTKFNNGERPTLDAKYTPKSIEAMTSSSLATFSVDTLVYAIDINFKYEEKNINTSRREKQGENKWI